MDQQSILDCVRQAIPQIRMCAESHPNKAAAATLRIWARNLECHLPEVVAKEAVGWDNRPLYE